MTNSIPQVFCGRFIITVNWDYHKVNSPVFVNNDYLVFLLFLFPTHMIFQNAKTKSA